MSNRTEIHAFKPGFAVFSLFLELIKVRCPQFLNPIFMKTKTILTIAGLILIYQSSVKAQHFKFGILSGLNITRTHWSQTYYNISHGAYTDPMISYNINGCIEYKSASFWGLSIEPGYIKKGGFYTENHDIRNHINFLELPILADFYITKKLFVSIGSGYSYFLNEKVKHPSTIDLIDIKVSGKRFEFFGLAGLNYSITKYMDLGIRYNQGWPLYNKDYLASDAFGNNIYVKSREFHQSIQLIVRLKI